MTTYRNLGQALDEKYPGLLSPEERQLKAKFWEYSRLRFNYKGDIGGLDIDVWSEGDPEDVREDVVHWDDTLELEEIDASYYAEITVKRGDITLKFTWDEGLLKRDTH